MRFTTTTGYPGSLNLHELAQQHANDLWVPTNLNEREAAAFALEHFRRQVVAELEMIEMRACDLFERSRAKAG